MRAGHQPSRAPGRSRTPACRIRSITGARRGWPAAPSSQSRQRGVAVAVEAAERLLEAVVDGPQRPVAFVAGSRAALVDRGPGQPVPAPGAGVPGVQVEGDHITRGGGGHVSGDARLVGGGLGVGADGQLTVAVGGQPRVLLRLVRARHQPQRPVTGGEFVEVDSELDAAHADAVVGVPAGLGEVQHAFGALGDDRAAEQALRGVDETRVVADQRRADQGERGGHRQVVATDPVDDTLVVGRRVGVADGRVGFRAQRGDAVGEKAAEHGEAERGEVVGLGGGKHEFLLTAVTGTVSG